MIKKIFLQAIGKKPFFVVAKAAKLASKSSFIYLNPVHQQVQLHFLPNYHFSTDNVSETINQALKLEKAGKEAYENNNFGEAEKNFVQALELRKKHPSTSLSNEIFGIHSILSQIYQSLGDMDKAIDHATKLVDVTLKLFPENNAMIVQSYTQLGRLYEQIGDLSEAINRYDTALKYAHLSKEPIKVADCKANLAVSYLSNRDYKKAIEYGEEVLSLLEGISNKTPDVLFSIAEMHGILGQAYSSMGEFEKAESLLKKCLEHIEKAPQAEPLLPQFLSHLAVVCDHLKKYDESLSYRERVMAIVDKLYGEDHHLMGIACNDLGVSYHLKGEFDKAVVYQAKAYNIYVKEYGEDHPNTISIKTNLAYQYENTQQYEKAWQLFSELYESLKKSDELHPVDEATLLTNIGSNQIRLPDRRRGFDNVLLKALEIATSTKEFPWVKLFNIYISLGQGFEEVNQIMDSVKYFEKAADLAKENAGKSAEPYLFAVYCKDRVQNKMFS